MEQNTITLTNDAEMGSYLFGLSGQIPSTDASVIIVDLSSQEVIPTTMEIFEELTNGKDDLLGHKFIYAVIGDATLETIPFKEGDLIEDIYTKVSAVSKQQLYQAQSIFANIASNRKWADHNKKPLTLDKISIDVMIAASENTPALKIIRVITANDFSGMAISLNRRETFVSE